MTSVNDKKLQNTLLQLDYYVEKGEMENVINQLNDVIYASSSPDLYFKDVTDNTFSWLGEDGGVRFYEDNFLQKLYDDDFLQKRLTGAQREQLKYAVNRSRKKELKQIFGEQNQADKDWAKEQADYTNKKHGLKGKNKVKAKDRLLTLQVRREQADKAYNKSVNAHNRSTSITEGIANFSRRLFSNEEDNQKTTSASKGFISALFNSGNSIDWTNENARPDVNIEKDGRKLRIRSNKAGGFDIFDVNNGNKKLNSKPIPKFTDAYQGSEDVLGGGGSASFSGGGRTGGSGGRTGGSGGGSGGTGSGGSGGDSGAGISRRAGGLARGIVGRGTIESGEFDPGILSGVLDFLKYQINEFKEGYVSGYRSQFSEARPTSSHFKANPQGYWEVRASLATQYAIGTANYESALNKVEKLKSDEYLAKLKEKNPDKSDAEIEEIAGRQRDKIRGDAWKEFESVRNSVEEDAIGIESSLDAVILHVNQIKDPTNRDVLPPLSGWPSKYGGKNRVRGLQRVLKDARLKPYSNDTFGGKLEEPKEEAKEYAEEKSDEEGRDNKEKQNKQERDEWDDWFDLQGLPDPTTDYQDQWDEWFNEWGDGGPSVTIDDLSSEELLDEWLRANGISGLNENNRAQWEKSGLYDIYRQKQYKEKMARYENMSSKDIQRDFMDSLPGAAAGVLPNDWRERWRNSDAYVFFRQAELKENADKYEKFKDMSSSEIASEYVKNIGVENFDLKKWRNTQEYQWFREKEQEEAQAANEERARERQREIDLAFINFHETGEWPVPTSEDAGGEEEQEGEQEQQDPNIANPSGESGDGGGSGDDVPPEYREYLDSGENPPEGIPLLTGTKRGQEGSVARFYDKRVAAAKKQGGGGGGVASGGGGNTPPGAPREGQQQQMPLQMPLEMSNDNEMTGDSKMAKPVDDYKEMIEQAVDKAKQQQSKSKVRSAKAQARVAKAHANEAEANAEAAEQKAEEKIASILHKLDSNISELNARKNPEINSVLSKLDSTIRFAKSNTKKN